MIPWKFNLKVHCFLGFIISCMTDMRIIRGSKRAIFFDFGDTMALTQPSYLIRVAIAMRTAGYYVSDEDFEIAYLKTDYEYTKSIKHKEK